MTRLDCNEVCIGHGVMGHMRHNADAEAQSHVSLDDIGIDGGQGNLRMQSRCLESAIQLRAAGEAEGVGNDGVLSQLLQRELG